MWNNYSFYYYYILPILLIYLGKTKKLEKNEVGIKHFDLIEEIIEKRKKLYFYHAQQLFYFFHTMQKILNLTKI